MTAIEVAIDLVDALHLKLQGQLHGAAAAPPAKSEAAPAGRTFALPERQVIMREFFCCFTAVLKNVDSFQTFNARSSAAIDMQF